MRVKAASIFQRKGDEDVRASMDPGDGLRGCAVRQELPVLNLFSSVAGDGGCVCEDRITVYRSHHCINDEVAALRKKVQDDHITRSRGVRNS